jgi:hypothetical protein
VTSLLLAELAGGGFCVHFTSCQHLLDANRLGRRNSATTMRCATSCWLLVALTATTALAQTHPKKKPVRKHAVVRQLGSESVKAQYPKRGYEEEGPPPLMPELQYPSPSPEPEVIESTKVYTYVEQMPLLNGQHAYLASSAAITRSVVVPVAAPAGRVYVQFIVTKEGQVSHPHIVKGLRADLDSAVVAATRQLPHFTPGKQGNRVVAVSITVGVTFPVAQQP